MFLLPKFKNVRWSTVADSTTHSTELRIFKVILCSWIHVHIQDWQLSKWPGKRDWQIITLNLAQPMQNSITTSERERERDQDFTYRQLTCWIFVYEQDNVLRAFGWQIYAGILRAWNDPQVDLPKTVTWKILLSQVQFGLKLHTNWL